MHKLDTARFIAQCLRPDSDPLSLINTARQGSVDWESLISLASGDRVISSLYGQMKRKGIARHLDGELLQYMDTICEAVGRRNMLLLDELEFIVEGLGSEGIKPVVLKGPALLLLGALPTEERIIRDIDLLVKKEDFEAALRAMRSMGYINMNTDAVVNDLDEWLSDDNSPHHYPGLAREGAGIVVELHKSIAKGPRGELVPPFEVFEDAIAINRNGVHYLVPSAEHMSVINIVQWAANMLLRSYREINLRTLYDHMIIINMIEHDNAFMLMRERFERNRMGRDYLEFWALACWWLGLDMPQEEFGSAVSKRAIRRCQLKIQYSWFAWLIGARGFIAIKAGNVFDDPRRILKLLSISFIRSKLSELASYANRM